MQVSAINPNFTGKRDRIDNFIGLSDNAVSAIAYEKTLSKANEKKHRRINKALIAAAPVAAGISAAVFSKGKSKIFSREVSGLTARLATGLKNSALWAVILGAVGVVCGTKSYLSNNSKDVREFEKKHPLLSLGTLFAAGLGALVLVEKGASKLAGVKAPKFLQKMTKNVNKYLNNSKNIQTMSKKVKVLGNKIPVALKSSGAKLLRHSPTILLLGGVLHSITHSLAVSKEFSKNYTDLKEKQLGLARARNLELEMENDFFKTNKQNKEDLELLKQPLKDLPDDVMEKADEIKKSGKTLKVSNEQPEDFPEEEI